MIETTRELSVVQGNSATCTQRLRRTLTPHYLNNAKQQGAAASMQAPGKYTHGSCCCLGTPSIAKSCEPKQSKQNFTCSMIAHGSATAGNGMTCLGRTLLPTHASEPTSPLQSCSWSTSIQIRPKQQGAKAKHQHTHSSRQERARMHGNKPDGPCPCPYKSSSAQGMPTNELLQELIQV